MPTELADLNERIREKARAELRNELEESAQPLRRMLQLGYTVEVELYNKAGNRFDSFTAIDVIVSALFKIKVTEREQDAIDEFMKKVDGLQEQIDQLVDSVGQDS